MGDIGSNTTLTVSETQADTLLFSADSTLAAERASAEPAVDWPIVLLAVLASALLIRLLYTKR